MEIKIEIPDYNPNEGVNFCWEGRYFIATSIDDENSMIIKANKEGLVSLARHFLTLSQEGVPVGSHLHFDQHNSLEEGSRDLVIEKIS